MVKVFIAIFFGIFIINMNLYSNGIAMSTVSDTNSYSWIKGRQMVGINFSTGYAGFLPSFLNAVTYDYEITTNFAKINLNLIIPELSKYLHNMNFKGSMWYVPNISYTFLYKPRLGFEFAMGAQSMSFSLTIPENKFLSLTSKEPNGDSFFESSYTYIPITLGVKLFAGKNRQIVNTFRLGLEPVTYSLKTRNAVTGNTTEKTYNNFNVYLSYEFGWSIELFPTREWPVKPYIDISLFEIGYYVKSSAHILYRDTWEHFSSFGAETVDLIIPSLDSLPSYFPYVAAIRFIFLPRIGFSLRF